MNPDNPELGKQVTFGLSADFKAVFIDEAPK
jgi:hypothetical protein